MHYAVRQRKIFEPVNLEHGKSSGYLCFDAIFGYGHLPEKKFLVNVLSKDKLSNDIRLSFLFSAVCGSRDDSDAHD